MTKIIVLTPVKNENWILNQFLTCMSLFVDCIIVADQMSTDGSREICSNFPKVHLIENNNDKYDEASRQILLIGEARRLYPDDKRIFLCLDSDEIFSSDSLNYKETWDRIKNLKVGTSIYMEKPDLLYGIEKCVRWRNNYFPIGYVDDGLQHQPTIIHSKRIPDNPSGEDVFIDDIKVLHFAHTRRKTQSSKLRYYSVIENINNSKKFYLRRFAYKCFYDETTNYPPENIEYMPDEWLSGWDERNIDFRHLPDPEFSWHDFEVLGYFKKYGYKKFFSDDIWGFDWSACRDFAKANNHIVPENPVIKPGIFYKLLLSITDKAYLTYRNLIKN